MKDRSSPVLSPPPHTHTPHPSRPVWKRGVKILSNVDNLRTFPNFFIKRKSFRFGRWGFIWGECKWGKDLYVGWHVGQYPWQLFDGGGGWHCVMLKESYAELWLWVGFLCACATGCICCMLLWRFSSISSISPVTYFHKGDNWVLLVNKMKICQEDGMRQEIWLQPEYSLPECILRYLTHHPSAFKRPPSGAAELLAT